MPELPEVENFRRLLLQLVSKKSTLTIECPSQTPPRTFLTPEQVKSLNGNCRVKDVLRKGKLICMVLECVEKVENQDVVYLFLHMGMTGRISTPSYVPALESLNNVVDYPPPHTYLFFRTDSAEACFSDPRKFGSVILSTTAQSNFDNLAPDALTKFNVEGLVGKAMGIKALLLDQKRVMSGVGNWVADEVLYQSELHPEQTFLSRAQAVTLQERLHFILNTAISCLHDREEFPDSWLFHCRWEKRASSNGTKIKDPMGRTVVFLKAAGRTSAIVPSIQVKRSSQNQPMKKNNLKKERESDDSNNAHDGLAKQNAHNFSDKSKAKRPRKNGSAKNVSGEGAPGNSQRRSPRFANS